MFRYLGRFQSARGEKIEYFFEKLPFTSLCEEKFIFSQSSGTMLSQNPCAAIASPIYLRQKYRTKGTRMKKILYIIFLIMPIGILLSKTNQLQIELTSKVLNEYDESYEYHEKGRTALASDLRIKSLKKLIQLFKVGQIIENPDNCDAYKVTGGSYASTDIVIKFTCDSRITLVGGTNDLLFGSKNTSPIQVTDKFQQLKNNEKVTFKSILYKELFGSGPYILVHGWGKDQGSTEIVIYTKVVEIAGAGTLVENKSLPSPE